MTINLGEEKNEFEPDVHNLRIDVNYYQIFGVDLGKIQSHSICPLQMNNVE